MAGERRQAGRIAIDALWGLVTVFIILGGILTMAATSGTVLQGGALLIAYSAGLGIPFVIIAALFPLISISAMQAVRAVSVRKIQAAQSLGATRAYVRLPDG